MIPQTFNLLHHFWSISNAIHKVLYRTSQGAPDPRSPSSLATDPSTMTIYAPGTPQEAIDAGQQRQAGMSMLFQKLPSKIKKFPCAKVLPCIKKLTASRITDSNGSAPAQSGTPPAPPPRYDSGGDVMVKTSTASGSGASSSQVRQYTPTGYTTSYGGGSGYGSGMIPPVPPVYPQRPEGNIGTQSGHVCMTYSNINHEMPHTEYMKMNDAQLQNFHNSGPWMPHYDAWTPAQGQGHGDVAGQGNGDGSKPCSLCRKPGELHKFEHVGAEWVICFKCAQDAFAAEGTRLWLDGKPA